MTWWQIILVFVGIPTAAFTVITLLVLRFATARVPDGIVQAAAAGGHDDTPSTIVDSGNAEDEGEPC